MGKRQTLQSYGFLHTSHEAEIHTVPISKSVEVHINSGPINLFIFRSLFITFCCLNLKQLTVHDFAKML